MLTRALQLLALILSAAPALAGGIGLVDEPRWSHGGICVDVSSSRAGGAIAVHSTDGWAVVAWRDGEPDPILAECGARVVWVNEGDPGREHRSAWFPLTCLTSPGPPVDDFSDRTVVVLTVRPAPRVRMSFDMGSPIGAFDPSAEGPCPAAP